MTSIQHTERLSRRLRIVRLVALIDLVLLLALLTAALTGQRAMVHLLGPLHGINFLLLLVTVVVGAIDDLWEWWFPVAVLLTAGPPGALLGEWIIARRIRRQHVRRHEAVSPETAMCMSNGEADTSDLFSSLREESVLEQQKEQG